MVSSNRMNGRMMNVNGDCVQVHTSLRVACTSKTQIRKGGRERGRDEGGVRLDLCFCGLSLHLLSRVYGLVENSAK